MGGRAQALLEGTDSGVVYASLGTLCTFGLEGFRRVAAALGALPQRVVWKLAPGDLPGNATLGALRLAPNLRVRPAAHMHGCLCGRHHAVTKTPSFPWVNSVNCRQL